jgi:hypothetical protein
MRGVRSTRAKDGRSQESVLRLERETDKVSVSITLGGRVYPVWFASSGEAIGREDDFLLPLTLFPAMRAGAHLKLPGEVSPRLLSTVPKIQEIFRLWGAEHWGGKLEDLHRVGVDAELRSGPARRASGVGCFFSGGLDSFYTLLKYRDEITHIIFVYGFDIALEDQALRDHASSMAREVARELGKTIIEVETNLRWFSNRMVAWPEYYGAALASVALLFQHWLRKVLIAGGLTYAELAPRGSHAMLDPLWSTELTEIEYDGGEATRVDKASYISEHELAMRWLRVCFLNLDGVYNCGRCEKCLRTMIALRISGALERCETLPSDIDLEEVANMHIPDGIVSPRHNLKALERLGTDPELTRALVKALEKSSGTSLGETEREHLQRRLSLSHKKLEASRTRSKRLARRNRLLIARYSGRRYRFADAFVSLALRIPGIGELMRRKDIAD